MNGVMTLALENISLMIIYTSVNGLKLDFLLHKSNEFFPEANRTLTDAKVGYNPIQLSSKYFN